MADPTTSTATPAAIPGAGVASGPLRWWQVLRWYVHSIMGDNAYQRYVEHVQHHHPGEPVPTERQFWKDKHADAERNPKTRCC